MYRNQEIREIKICFDKILAARGTIEKRKVIENMESTAANRALRLLINPHAVFHMDKRTIEKEVVHPDIFTYEPFDNIFACCDYLQSRPALSYDDICMVQKYLSTLEQDLREFVKAFLTKSIKLGVSVKTYNKCMGVVPIKTMPCMLAERYTDHKESVEGHEFTITLKLDGERCLCFADQSGVRFFTRQGKPIYGLTEISAEIEKVAGGTPSFFDGELLVEGGINMPSKDAYKKTMQIVRSNGEKTGVQFCIFDLLTMEEYESGHTPTYKERRERLVFALESYGDRLHHLIRVPSYYMGDDVTQIERFHSYAKASHQEGVMINLNDAPYQKKRTKALLKVKAFNDADLRIIDMKPGEGKYLGSLGCLIVDYKGTPVGVGTGYSDADRRFLWDHREELIGRVAKISYFEETTDDTGRPSLRFAGFEELRDEGKEVSYA